MSFWPLFSMFWGGLAAAVLGYILVSKPTSFTRWERTGFGLVAAGLVLTIGPIMSTAPTPFEDWSGALLRVGLAIFAVGNLMRHRHNNAAAVRQARAHLGRRQ